MNENMNVNGLKHHDNHRRIIYRNRGSLEKSRLLAFGRSEMDRAALQVCGPLDLQGERMNIDWSKAPEGATHWDSGMNNRVAGWMKLEDGVWYWWPAENAFSCPKKWHASLNQHMVQTEVFVERPAPWKGEGLPPVGTVCEAMLPSMNFQWAEAVVVWHHPEHENSAVVVHGGGRLTGWSSTFRPIRTPEQIAEEARIAELNLMIGAIKDHPGGRHGVDHLTQLKIHEEACIDLYDAGWRKQVSK